jgi:hypothetical protein
MGSGCAAAEPRSHDPRLEDNASRPVNGPSFDRLPL